MQPVANHLPLRTPHRVRLSDRCHTLCCMIIALLAIAMGCAALYMSCWAATAAWKALHPSEPSSFVIRHSSLP